MTLAELEALAQFEASDRKGEAVFHPRVGPDSPAPNCVVLPEGLTRIASPTWTASTGSRTASGTAATTMAR